ncbi:MAG: AgmX/PglI C-terminal domain-containing protein [Spirochaetes bacterium]|nr:AgmX/PglI C-terminal domain-containing protein [Spirochaetota bacterium]
MNLNKNTTIIIIVVTVIFLALLAFMFYRMTRMEERYLQLMSQSQQGGPGRDGRSTDPYISGPVKNTVVKHSSEILSCYREFLERNKENKDPKFQKEGSTTMDWQVDDDGGVLSPSVVRSSFTDGTFHSCMVKKIAAWRFPEPPFGTKKYVEHTFKFQDEKKQ